MPKSLDLNKLKRFEPIAQPSEHVVSSDLRSNLVDDPAERWPSREPMADSQISIKGSLSTIRRFKALCKNDRRTYADMLNILMDRLEDKS